MCNSLKLDKKWLNEEITQNGRVVILKTGKKSFFMKFFNKQKNFCNYFENNTEK